MKTQGQRKRTRKYRRPDRHEPGFVNLLIAVVNQAERDAIKPGQPLPLDPEKREAIRKEAQSFLDVLRHDAHQNSRQRVYPWETRNGRTGGSLL